MGLPIGDIHPRALRYTYEGHAHRDRTRILRVSSRAGCGLLLLLCINEYWLSSAILEHIRETHYHSYYYKQPSHWDQDVDYDLRRKAYEYKEFSKFLVGQNRHRVSTAYKLFHERYPTLSPKARWAGTDTNCPCPHCQNTVTAHTFSPAVPTLRWSLPAKDTNKTRQTLSCLPSTLHFTPGKPC